jgi:hypothetical protein
VNISILWLDDEFDSEALKSTFIRMEKHFRLIKCYTKDEFLDKIESENWDAIVLDVLDANGRDSGFQTAVRRILKDYKDEPWFVFSGQENVTKKESDIQIMLAEEDCHREYADIIYVKSEHNDKLIEDISAAVSNKPAWQARNAVRDKYRMALSSFDLIGNTSKEPFFDILMAIEGYKEIDHKVYYTPLRIVLEWIFRDANKKGLLHDKCIASNGKLNLTESCLFLAGKQTKHLGVYSDIAHFPKIIANNIKNILEITGGASHTSEPEKAELVNLHTYWTQVKSPFLLYSLTFMLCDILIWYKEYIAVNNDVNTNKSHWKTIPQDNVVTGKITNFSQSGFAFLKPNGSADSKENCSIRPECCVCKDIQINDILTIEYVIKQKQSGEDIRTATKIIGKEQ